MEIIYALPIKNLDKLPKPARELVDMNNYNMMQDGERTATLISSRGCNGSCVYCSRASMGRVWRGFSPEYIVEEMKELFVKYGYESFYFFDDTFSFDHQRVFDLCKLIKYYLPDIKFRITTRADKLDYEMLCALKMAGCNIISIGIEHADNNVLRKAGKGMTIEQNEQVVKWCHELNIKVKGFFIVNLPGATEVTVKKTLQWAMKYNLDSADFYSLTAFPGSLLWENASKFGMNILSRDFCFYQATCNKPKVNIDSKELPEAKVVKLVEYCKEEWSEFCDKRECST